MSTHHPQVDPLADGPTQNAAPSGNPTARLRRAVDAAAIPGMPTHLLDFDPTDLLDIPGGDPR